MYSAITNYGKVTLPSVESWGQNNNILRDPPKSITTRRIEKVSETSMLNEDIDMATERVAESILVYPRGINPMVGVSFDNNGSNAGVRSGQSLLYKGQQTKLPYRVVRDGAFRAPILRQVDLLPLSRLPRNNTTILPIANTPDFTKKLVHPGEAKDYRSVKNTLIQVNTETKKTQNIQQATQIDISSKYTQDVIQMDKKSNINYTFDNTQSLNKHKKHTDYVIRDIIKYNYNINPSKNINVISFNDSKIVNKTRLKNHNQLEVITNTKGPVTKIIHHEKIGNKNSFKPVLKGEIVINNSQSGLSTRNNIINKNTKTTMLDIKPVLKGTISTNNSLQGLSNENPGNLYVNRNVKIIPKISPGSMEPTPMIPTSNRMNDEVSLQDKGNSLFSKARRFQTRE